MTNPTNDRAASPVPVGTTAPTCPTCGKVATHDSDTGRYWCANLVCRNDDLIAPPAPNLCAHCGGAGKFVWLRPGNRPTTSPCEHCQPKIATTLTVTNAPPAPTVLLGDRSAFVEREFFCRVCDGFRDVRTNQQDIVCEACDSIVATFKDRPILAPPAPTSETADALADVAALEAWYKSRDNKQTDREIIRTWADHAIGLAAHIRRLAASPAPAATINSTPMSSSLTSALSPAAP